MSYLMQFNPNLPHTQVRTNNGIGFANVDHNGNIISHAVIPQQNGYAPVNPNSGARHMSPGFPNQGYPNPPQQNYAHPAAAHYAPQMQQPRQDAWMNAYSPMAQQPQKPMTTSNPVMDVYNRLNESNQPAAPAPVAQPATAPKAKPTFISAIGGILGYQKYRGEEMAFLDPDSLLIQVAPTRKANHYIAVSSNCETIAMPVIYRGKITEILIKGIRKMDIAQHLGRPTGIPESSIIVPEETVYRENHAVNKRELTINENILDAVSPDSETEYALLAGSPDTENKVTIIKVDRPICSVPFSIRATLMEDVHTLRQNLTKSTGMKTYDLLLDFKKALSRNASPLIAMAFDSHLTNWLNKVLRTRMPVDNGISKLAVDDFFEDYASLLDVIRENEAGTGENSAAELAEILDSEKQTLVSFTFTEFGVGETDVILTCFGAIRMAVACPHVVDRYETGHIRQDILPSIHDIARSSFDAIDENFVDISEKLVDLGVPTERIYEIDLITETQVVTIQRNAGVPGLERMFVSSVKNRY